MGKIAFVFAGQGTQHTGMGQDFHEKNHAAAAVMAAADAIRPGTSEQCFHADSSVLNETRNTQPCLFAAELSMAAALRAAGIRADMTAGFSLGELAALAYAGAGEFDDMFRLVCKRGEIMQQAAAQYPAAMVAVLKLPPEQVESLCKEFSAVYPVNFNCPGQVSVSAAAEEMPAFCDAVKAAGGRTVPLKVTGGFHSPFMNGASSELKEALRGIRFAKPAIPVYANLTGEIYSEDIAEMLEKQICSPVLWEKTIRRMTADGADTFIEVGPGETLCGMIKRIDSTVRTFRLSAADDLEKIKAEVLS